jgi:hypothetical protein
MVNLHLVLFIAAIVLFIVAALPLNLRVRCEWLAFAALTTAYIV